MKHVRYRADIDGLRAVAILSVIGFHYFPSKIQGGFIGVDIFFVISGYLISSIIMGNLEKNNFSYIEFYQRRIKRIFPALLLVVGVSWLVGWLVLFPDEFEQLGKHTVAGIGFISNLILWSEAGYFDVASETKPFLHLWSLGIEEQFYIIWPILLGLVWKNKCNFIAIIILITIVSFCVNLTSYSDASRFYSPFSRFWELMIGGLLAYIYIHKQNMMLANKFYINMQSLFGVLLILLSLYLLDKTKIFPGWWALLPTIGTFLIISSPGSWINHNILGNRKLVYIGLISYPLYLWHWPLLSFSNILGYSNRGTRLILVALSFLLAWMTYEFVEKKIKQYKGVLLVFSLLAISGVIMLFGAIGWATIIFPRNHSQGALFASQIAHERGYPTGLLPYKINDVNAYIKTGAREKVLFIGDSHMQQYSPRIVKLINQDSAHTKTAVFATIPGCPPIPSVYEDHHPTCDANFRESVIKYALSSEIDSVVIAFSSKYLIKGKQQHPKGYKYYYLLEGNKIYLDKGGRKLALKSLENLLSLIAKKKKVFLVIDNPEGSGFSPKKAFFTGTRITGIGDIQHEQHFQKYNTQQAQERKVLLDIAKRSNAEIIDSVKFFCGNNKCATSLKDGTPIYVDEGHMRPSYVQSYVEYLDVTVKKTMK